MHAGVRPAVHFAATMCCFHPTSFRKRNYRPSCPFLRSVSFRPILAAAELIDRTPTLPAKKPPICTADELHYVSVPGTVWRLGLWRYTPPPNAPPRNHPLVLLSGVGMNAISLHLLATCLDKGFDTWIVEVRGAGLSIRDEESFEAENSVNRSLTSKLIETVEDDVQNAARSAEQHPEINTTSSKSRTTHVKEERISGFLNERQLKFMLADFIDQLSKLLEDT